MVKYRMLHKGTDGRIILKWINIKMGTKNHFVRFLAATFRTLFQKDFI